MLLGTVQDTGKALIRPSDHRVTHDGHGKTAKAAEEALRAQNGALGRSAAPTESTLHAPRACPTLRDSLPPHAGIGGNAWGTAPRSKRRPNVGRLQYYKTPEPNLRTPPNLFIALGAPAENARHPALPLLKCHAVACDSLADNHCTAGHASSVCAGCLEACCSGPSSCGPCCGIVLAAACQG